MKSRRIHGALLHTKILVLITLLRQKHSAITVRLATCLTSIAQLLTEQAFTKKPTVFVIRRQKSKEVAHNLYCTLKKVSINLYKNHLYG